MLTVPWQRADSCRWNGARICRSRPRLKTGRLLIFAASCLCESLSTPPNYQQIHPARRCKPGWLPWQSTGCHNYDLTMVRVNHQNTNYTLKTFERRIVKRYLCPKASLAATGANGRASDSRQALSRRRLRFVRDPCCRARPFAEPPGAMPSSPRVWQPPCTDGQRQCASRRAGIVLLGSVR